MIVTAAVAGMTAGLVPPVTAQPAQTASLEVQLGSPLGPMSPQLFGSNVLWSSQYDFLEPGTTTFYPTFLNQVASVGFGAQRFPGGTLGSYYHWQQGIGPIADRGRNTYFGNNAEPSLLGSDEFGTLLSTSGAAGDIIVNPSTGTLAEAADWVAYMTLPAPTTPVTDPANPAYWAGLRAKNGHPAPYDVPWWEVGNEVNVGSSGNPGWMDGTLVSYANPHCASPNVLACLYDFGGTTAFTDQPVGGVADKSPQQSMSDGSPGQTKYVVYAPVAPPGLALNVGGKPWTEVADLADQPANAPVYTLDASSGEITFGDGVHGAIPPKGAAITASYQSGPHPGFVDYYRAMKQVNPAIRVCLGASSVFPDISPYLEDLGSTNPYDCVPTHPYVRNGTSLAAGEISNGLSQSDYDNELLALPGVLAGQVQTLRSEIDRYAGPRGSHVTIPITEYGQLRSSSPTFDKKFHYSLEEGILIADELRQWVDLGVPLAEHYLLGGAPFGSAAPPGSSATTNDNSEIVGPGPDTFLEPTAFVEQLFRPLGGQNHRQVAAAGVPTISLPDGSSVPALETVGAVSQGKVTLVVINQSTSQNVVTSVSTSAAPLRSGTLTTLDGPNELSYNSPTSPDTVGLRTTELQGSGGSVAVTFPAHSVSLLRLSTAPSSRSPA